MLGVGAQWPEVRFLQEGSQGAPGWDVPSSQWLQQSRGRERRAGDGLGDGRRDEVEWVWPVFAK